MATETACAKKLAHKSGGPWVRVASSAQSLLDGPSHLNAPPAETARWKRRVPPLGDDVQGLIITMFTAYSVSLKFSKVRERNNAKQKD
jgi:hypothetical protein